MYGKLLNINLDMLNQALSNRHIIKRTTVIILSRKHTYYQGYASIGIGDNESLTKV